MFNQRIGYSPLTTKILFWLQYFFAPDVAIYRSRALSPDYTAFSHVFRCLTGPLNHVES